MAIGAALAFVWVLRSDAALAAPSLAGVVDVDVRCRGPGRDRVRAVLHRCSGDARRRPPRGSDRPVGGHGVDVQRGARRVRAAVLVAPTVTAAPFRVARCSIPLRHGHGTTALDRTPRRPGRTGNRAARTPRQRRRGRSGRRPGRRCPAVDHRPRAEPQRAGRRSGSSNPCPTCASSSRTSPAPWSANAVTDDDGVYLDPDRGSGHLRRAHRHQHPARGPRRRGRQGPADRRGRREPERDAGLLPRREHAQRAEQAGACCRRRWPTASSWR